MGKDGVLWVGVVALNFEHPLRALHASPSQSEGEVPSPSSLCEGGASKRSDASGGCPGRSWESVGPYVIPCEPYVIPRALRHSRGPYVIPAHAGI